MQLLRTKPLEHFQEASALKRCLHAKDLVLLGVGAILGAGVFVLTGVAAATQAGPAVVISYLLAGIACALSAFSYAELSSSIGGSGSAYGYSYAGMGEIFAWIIGWSLILEYSIATATVAIGWSGYINSIFVSLGIHLPLAITAGPSNGGFINLPAILVITAVTALLCLGVSQSAKINNIVVFIKLTAIIVFIIVASMHIHPSYWLPFAPFGWKGIAHGAAIVFFAFIGFDAVSTAAEEAVDPQRDLPIGIIASLLICTTAYIAVAGLLTGIAHYETLNTASPVSDALLQIGSHFAAGIISAGAVAGLTTVMQIITSHFFKCSPNNTYTGRSYYFQRYYYCFSLRFNAHTCSS
jgi:APA family basic amino acid/polyamine antiporter